MRQRYVDCWQGERSLCDHFLHNWGKQSDLTTDQNVVLITQTSSLYAEWHILIEGVFLPAHVQRNNGEHFRENALSESSQVPAHQKDLGKRIGVGIEFRLEYVTILTLNVFFTLSYRDNHSPLFHFGGHKRTFCNKMCLQLVAERDRE